MQKLEEQEAREILKVTHYCDEATAQDWMVLQKPRGAFSFEQGLINEEGRGTGLVVELHFYRSPETRLITVKMGVFMQKKRSNIKQAVYQLHITTKSYNPDDWHDEAHEHFGKSRHIIPEWKTWKNFSNILEYFRRVTNIQFRPPLEDPEQLRLMP